MLTMFWAAWRFSGATEVQAPLVTTGQEIIVMDGDSFNVGFKKFRLDGIAAPELNQIYKDAKGTNWGCGKAT